VAVVAALLVALVAPAALSGTAPISRAKAPVGVWVGPGNQADDHEILAVAAGPAGAQPAFYGTYISASVCNNGAGVMYGTASLSGSTLSFAGDFVCVDTGTVALAGVVLSWTYDPAADTIFNPSFQSGPANRACRPGTTTHVGTAAGEKIVGTSGHDIIDGRGGNDILIGKGGMDVLCGAGGRDSLRGGTGIDVLIGGAGNDTLLGGSGWDHGVGGGGKDILKGNGGSDFLVGGAKRDRAFGGNGNDLLLGGGGNDVLKGQKGPADTAVGGTGTDTCIAETETGCEA
jgi:Ca2+-binding RTX toxin-like protein